MKVTSILAIALTLCLVFMTYNSQATAPGLITSISGTGLTNVVQQILPLAFEMIKEIPIDDMSSGHTTISSIRVPKISLSSFNIGTKYDNQVFLSLTALHVDVKAHFRYKNSLFSVSGDVNGSATGSGTLAAQLVPKGDRFVISLTEADININDFSLRISGGIAAKILNIVKALFQGMVKGVIKKKMAGAIRSAIFNVANSLADSIPSSYAFGTAGHVISLAPAAFGTRYDSNSVSVAFNGAIDGNENTPRHGIDQAFMPSGALFDILVDVFTFNSGCLAIIPFKTLEYSRDYPGSLPVPGWYGKDWGLVIPAMALLLPNEPVRIQISLLETPVMTSFGGKVSLKALGGYRIFAGHTQVALVKAQIGGGITVALEKRDGHQFITPQLQDVGVKFTVTESFSGDIPLVNALEAILNVLTMIATGIIDQTMLDGILIPSISGLEFINPQISFPTDAIRLATDISFTPPPF